MEGEDNGHDTDLGDNYINYDNSNDSNSQEPQTKKFRYSSCSSGFGPTNDDANEDEDENTKQLTNNELQRLVLLEQLRVAKLQGECAELKLRRLTQQSTVRHRPNCSLYSRRKHSPGRSLLWTICPPPSIILH